MHPNFELYSIDYIIGNLSNKNIDANFLLNSPASFPITPSRQFICFE